MLTNTLPTNKWQLKSSGKFSITTLAETILMQSHKGFLRPALQLRLSVTFPGKMWSLYWLVSCISGLSKATACVRTDCRILQLETVVNDRAILRQEIRRIHLGMRPTGNSTVWFGQIDLDWLLVNPTPGWNISHICCFLSYLPYCYINPLKIC